MGAQFAVVMSIVLGLMACVVNGYKIVFMIHGVMGDKGSLDFLTDFIKQVRIAENTRENLEVGALHFFVLTRTPLLCHMLFLVFV